MPACQEVQALVVRELGEPVYDARPPTPARPALTWAAHARTTGPIVVKARKRETAARTARPDGARRTFPRSARAGTPCRTYGDALADAECAAFSTILDRFAAT